ncbi:MAG: C4-dicarboxylate ABC transporter substrate-binding protein [Rhodospirillaceae bacterium]|nr:C4-dicarboxylate ABC transporter substrate-binding protein [Rhodospirillaceae bacterium]|tara:strand:+ start:1600 stop:2112 length:513 start_codon:yes stop_codon:yes gene_type:complete
MLSLCSLIDNISKGVGVTAATLVLPLGLIMTYEALARFLLNLPTFWAYELSYMLTGAHFALGIALVTRNSEHIRIDFLYARMPELSRKLIDFFILLFCMVPLMFWVSWGLINYAWNSWVIGEVSGESGWNPLIWPVRSAVAIGFLLFAIQLVSETIKTGHRVSILFRKKS